MSDTHGQRCVQRIRQHLSATTQRWGQLTGEVVAKLIDEQYALDNPPERRKRAAFTPPSPEQVEAYSREIGYPLDGQAWCDFYERKGWKVGSAKMKKWEAAVRNWKAQGWKLGSAGTAPALGRSSSEDALKRELEACENALRAILYVGGAAYKTTPTGENKRRYEQLLAERTALKQRLEAFTHHAACS